MRCKISEKEFVEQTFYFWNLLFVPDGTKKCNRSYFYQHIDLGTIKRTCQFVYKRYSFF